MTRRRVAVSIVVLAAVGGLTFITLPYAHGLSLVIRAADLQGVARRVADLDASPVGRRELQIPVRSGTLRARVYEPAGQVRRSALLVSGVHPAGIDEMRFMGLAEDLAAGGVIVVTPDVPDLKRFAMTTAITDAIEESAAWLAAQPAFAPDGRVGVMGISFSGGLATVAAGRAGLRDRVAFVFSYGGHADLPRVLKYLCTGVETPAPDSDSALNALRLPGSSDRQRAGGNPDSARPAMRTPHDYGVALLLLNLADKVAPPAQVEPLRAAVRRFLEASALDRVDKPKAQAEFAALRAVAKKLPQPSATLLGYVNDRDVVHLGARLAPHLGSFGADPALSPARAPQKPGAPVFLMHGIDDNLIPAEEAAHLSAALRGVTPVRLLLTGLITHGDINRPARFGDVINLASFWGDLLSR